MPFKKPISSRMRIDLHGKKGTGGFDSRAG